MYLAIGCGHIEINEGIVKALCKKQNLRLLNRLWPFGKKPADDSAQHAADHSHQKEIDTKKVYVLRSVNGVHNYKIAQCCNPIPGDDVVGYIDDDNNVVVHKMDCETATRLKSSFGNRLVATQWEESPQVTSFMATIHIEGIDRMGILQELIHEISINMSINIRNLNIEANQGVFTCNLVVRVSDAAIVVRMCRQIKKINGVKSAVRTS